MSFVTSPDQIPQRLEDLRCEPASQTGEELWEEHRAASRQQVAELLVCRSGRQVVTRLGQEREVLGEEEPDLAVVRAARTPADPDRGAGCEERVEIALVVATHARRQDARLEIGRGNERAL